MDLNESKKIKSVLNLKMLFRSEKGQGLTEYAVILSLVAVASIAAMAFFGGTVKAKMAALSGAVAGSDVSKVKESDKKADKFAQSAAKKAASVKGTTVIDEDDIFKEEK